MNVRFGVRQSHTHNSSRAVALVKRPTGRAVSILSSKVLDGNAVVSVIKVKRSTASLHIAGALLDKAAP